MNIDLQLAIDRAIDPITNGLASFAIAVFAGLVIALVFRIFGQRFLDRILIPVLVTCDRILVNFIAPLTGVGLERDALRWTSFLCLFLTLTAIAVFAPVLIAAVAIVVGILAVLAIYRAWEKDEREREIAEDNGIAPPQVNDLGNEIVAGLLFLIVFFTLGFSRLSEQEIIYRGEAAVPIATTAAFIWGEILKALPIVDASEVYGFRNISGLEAEGALGRTLTFVFRVFLDLLLIATLLRLVSVVRRRSSGQDLRDIRSFYASADTAKVTEALNKLSVFALRGSLNAQNELERIALRERDIPQLKQPDILFDVGGKLRDLADKFGGIKHLLPAVEAYRGALAVRTREAMPADWATTQNNLGNALSSLGEITGDAGRLEEAMAAYRAALEVRTREAMPADWATTQSNLGNALSSLGEIAGDAARLEEAMTAYRAALEVRTREAMPADWATTQNNLGIALHSLGTIASDAGRLEEAMTAYRAALEVRTREAMPANWATTQNNLGIALYSRGTITGDAGQLEEAVAAYRAALDVRTREAMPADWATTQNNLGIALYSLGMIAGDASRLEETVAVYRAALDVRTREAMPADWAMTQTYLGTALASLGQIAGDTGRLEEALALWAEAEQLCAETGQAALLRDIQNRMTTVTRILMRLSAK